MSGYESRYNVAVHARGGDFEPLAKHIEAGGELNDDERKVLVAILRKELRFKRGNKRTFAQRLRDTDASFDVRLLQIAGLTRSRAIKEWLDANPGVGEETLKKMLQRAARDAKARRK